MPDSLVPSVVANEKDMLAEYAGFAAEGLSDVHDAQELSAPILRWKHMGASTSTAEGGKFYNSLEGNEAAYDEIPAVILDGKNSRSYYASNFDPKSKAPATPPDCKSSDGITGQGSPGGSCEACPLSKWVDGNPPPCALSYDRLIYDFHTHQVGIMSFQRSKIKALQEFQKAIKARNGGAIPMWAYKVRITSERKDAYWVPRFEIDGVLPKEEAIRFLEMKKEAQAAFMRVSTQDSTTATAANIGAALDDGPTLSAADAAAAY